MTKAEMVALLKEEVKGLTSYLTADTDYNNACDDAARETGWAFPVTTDFKIYWQKERAKRHIFFYLLSEAAHKFKFKQINLQHRFDHYRDMIFGKYGMDARFATALLENPVEFAGAETYELFGTKIDAGFQYQPYTGVDTTYSEDNVVIHQPDDTDEDS